jgi:hypothetical protein
VDTVEDQETNETPVTTLDTSAKNYYQAIGWLRGKVIKEEERFCVQIRDVNFPLYLPRRVMAVAANLEGQMAWMKCYPQSKGEGLSFKVVWMGTEQHEKSDPGIFVLRGVWQFIPQSRRPVFSIYRNELKNYENRPNNQHLPLIWSDQPPYRFRKDSEERPKFYQIMARLIPQRNCFGFVSQIADPLEQTPKRVKKTPPGAGDKKPSKENKQGDDQTLEGKEKPAKSDKSDKAVDKEKPAKSDKSDKTVDKEKTAKSDKAVESTAPNDTAPQNVSPSAPTQEGETPTPEAPIATGKASSDTVNAEGETPSVSPETPPEALSTDPEESKPEPVSESKTPESEPKAEIPTPAEKPESKVEETPPAEPKSESKAETPPPVAEPEPESKAEPAPPVAEPEPESKAEPAPPVAEPEPESKSEPASPAVEPEPEGTKKKTKTTKKKAPAKSKPRKT